MKIGRLSWNLVGGFPLHSLDDVSYHIAPWQCPRHRNFLNTGFRGIFRVQKSATNRWVASTSSIEEHRPRYRSGLLNSIAINRTSTGGRSFYRKLTFILLLIL